MLELKEGFTIVELIIVIVVIAILATVSVIAYRGIQARARASMVSSASAQAAKKLALFYVGNSAYPADNASFYTAIGADSSGKLGSVQFQYTVDNTSNPPSYCATATYADTVYLVTNDTSPVAGACAGHTVSGPNITNLAYNPSAASNVNGWSSWAGNGGGSASTASVAASWSTRGTAARVTWTAASSTASGDIGWFAPNTGGASSLQPNTQYTATWKMRTSKAQLMSALVSNCAIQGGASGSGSAVVNSRTPAAVANVGDVVNQWATFTTGANTISCKIYSRTESGAGSSPWNVGDYVEVSDMMLVEGSAQRVFADGNSAGWSWAGSPNSSISSGPAL